MTIAPPAVEPTVPTNNPALTNLRTPSVSVEKPRAATIRPATQSHQIVVRNLGPGPAQQPHRRHAAGDGRHPCCRPAAADAGPSGKATVPMLAANDEPRAYYLAASQCPDDAVGPPGALRSPRSSRRSRRCSGPSPTSRPWRCNWSPMKSSSASRRFSSRFASPINRRNRSAARSCTASCRWPEHAARSRASKGRSSASCNRAK